MREAVGVRWGVKAPGILCFWDAWRELLPVRSVVLVPFRHPCAVAASFERYGLERAHALALWLQLNTLALRAATNGPFEAVFLNFDDRQQFARALQRVLGPLRRDVQVRPETTATGRCAAFCPVS